MENQDIQRIAMEQSAIDCNCPVGDFVRKGTMVVHSTVNTGAKKCYHQPLFCGLAYYGEGLVASVDARIKDYMETFLSKYGKYRCFYTPQLIVLNKELEKYGECVCFIAQFFLPDIKKEVVINEELEVHLLAEEGISSLYQDKRFSMALGYDSEGEKRDVLAAVGYLNEELVGAAGASSDCETMWQVGIDVLPEYRRLGGGFHFD